MALDGDVVGLELTCLFGASGDEQEYRRSEPAAEKRGGPSTVDGPFLTSLPGDLEEEPLRLDARIFFPPPRGSRRVAGDGRRR